MRTDAAVLYLDASAIVKLVVRETESAALAKHLEHSTLLTSEISEVEVPRVALLRGGGEAGWRRAHEVLDRFVLVPLDERLRRDASRLGPVDVRSLDAIHVASCLRVRDRVRAAVAYDRRLVAALAAHGIAVEAPTA